MEASRGPDEVWYRRAVESAAAAASVHQPAYQMDQVDHWVVSVPLVDEPEADVYSEYNAAYDPDDPWAARKAGLADHWLTNGMPTRNPNDETYRQEVLEKALSKQVTMTAAVFKKKAPAAVAGLRFPQGTIRFFFEKTVGTLDCPGTVERCGDTCASDKLDCFLVDEHAIVVADETRLQAGRPLALVNRDLMVRLEAAKVFQRVTVSDYQGVCRRKDKHGDSEDEEEPAAPSTTPVPPVPLTTPKPNRWFTPVEGPAATDFQVRLRHALKPLRVKKTILQLCDMKVDLHRLGPGLHHRQSLPPLSCEKRSFAAAAVPGTNLVLLTALNNCPQLEQLEPFATKPWEATVRRGEPVFRKQGLLWPRRRPPTACYREHVGERNITQCGGAHRDRGLHLAVLAALAALPLLTASA
ncbi:hypothetical protein FOCC_FOCC004385 [Frankliniella occidentalis]|nr:hypothetical protein FOCC_FOCC004385 [Frankliniella occidentalis]